MAESSTAEQKTPPTLLAILVVILLGAALLYFHDVEARSFWLDESWSAVAVMGSPLELWQFAAAEGVHPPLHYAVLWGFVRLVGDSEFAIRGLSGLVALLGIALTYRLAADWYGPTAGGYAALLAAGSVFIAYAAREARHYTTFYALSVLMLLLYERWRRHGGRWWLGMAITMAALLYNHYFGAWLAVIIGLHGLLTLPGRRKLHLIAALALGGVLFLPWAPVIVGQYASNEGGLSYASQHTLLAFISYIDRLWAGQYVLGILLLALGLGMLIWRWQGRRLALFLIWLILPITITLAVNTVFPVFLRRTLIFTVSGFSILFAVGLAGLTKQSRAGRMLAPVLALLFVGIGLSRYNTFSPHVGMPDWHSIAHAIAWDYRPGDVMMVAGEPYSMTYYLNRLAADPPPVIGLADWLAYDGAPARVWLTGTRQAVPFEAIDALPPGMIQTRRYVLGVLVSEFYQREPEDVLTTFGGQLALGLAEASEWTARPGDTLAIDLWWRPGNTAPQADYSVGVYVLDAGGAVRAQQDRGIDSGRVSTLALPTDTWTPDARVLPLPEDMPAGQYAVVVSVYDWQTGERLTPAGGRADNLYELGTLTVE